MKARVNSVTYIIYEHEEKDRTTCRGPAVDRRKCHTMAIVKLDRELARSLEQLCSWDGSER